jgi:hypothetical protein
MRWNRKAPPKISGIRIPRISVDFRSTKELVAGYSLDP